MMPRNLDRRVEVLVPVESARSRQELQAVLGSVFADDVHAWLLASDGSWSRGRAGEARQAGRPPGRDDEARAAARAPPDRRRHARQGALATLADAPVCLSGSPVKMSWMRVAIIDVGSNTARLLVANVTAKGAVVPVAEEREYLRLGAEIERTGTLSAKKIAAAADTCGAYARRIAELDVERATVIVTAPGRQGAAAPELTAALARRRRLPVRVLTAESEGRLAYDGAVARAVGDLPEVVAVVDVGGGSTEVVVGTPLLGAAWVRSADVGSLRLTRAHLTDDPPSAAQIRAAPTPSPARSQA